MRRNRRARIAVKNTKIETAKKIVWYCDVLLAVVTVCILFAMFMQIDSSNVTVVHGTLAGLSATAHGFYFWKAKQENLRKHVDVNALIEKMGVQGYLDLMNNNGGYI